MAGWHDVCVWMQGNGRAECCVQFVHCEMECSECGTFSILTPIKICLNSGYWIVQHKFSHLLPPHPPWAGIKGALTWVSLYCDQAFFDQRGSWGTGSRFVLQHKTEQLAGCECTLRHFCSLLSSDSRRIWTQLMMTEWNRFLLKTESQSTNAQLSDSPCLTIDSFFTGQFHLHVCDWGKPRATLENKLWMHISMIYMTSWMKTASLSTLMLKDRQVLLMAFREWH